VEYKTIISLFTVILTFIGYIPYIWNTLKKKTTPHSFTWFIFTLVGGIAFGLQVKGGAGVGSWPLLTNTIFCFLVFVLSLKTGEKNITYSDIIFLTLALCSLFLWIVVKQPVLSVILATGVEVLGFIPTVRKSWNKPYSETLWIYVAVVIRHIGSIFALQRFNILTVLYPVTWSLSCLLFIITLLIRRKAVPVK